VDVVSLGGTIERTDVRRGDRRGRRRAGPGGGAGPVKDWPSSGRNCVFASAQLIEIYGTPLWAEFGRAGEQPSRELAIRLQAFAAITVAYPVQANAVFVRVPPAVASALAEQFWCQTFVVPERLVRLMCSWDTTNDDLDRVIASSQVNSRPEPPAAR